MTDSNVLNSKILLVAMQEFLNSPNGSIFRSVVPILLNNNAHSLMFHIKSFKTTLKNSIIVLVNHFKYNFATEQLMFIFLLININLADSSL